MGAINYGKNKDFVTLGYDTRELNEEEDYVWVQDEYEQVKWMLDDFKSDNIKVSVESGYYEGFWIKIELTANWFWNYNEKLQTLKNVTKLKKILLAILEDFSVVAVDSWWVSTWYSKEDTIKKVKQSAIDLKNKIKKMYTDKTLPKNWFNDNVANTREE